MNSEKLKKELYAYFLLIVGSALFAVGDVMFVNPYHLAPGGVYGLSNVFNSLWPWKISLYAICMDIPLLIIGTIILGPRFGIKTIVSVVLIFLFTYILESTYGYAPLIHDGLAATAGEGLIEIGQGGGWFKPDYFLNSVVGGLVYGISIGLIFKSGATSGGSDIISMILHKYTKVSLGTLVLIVDSCIALSTLVAFQDVRLPIYSIILIYIESKIIDLVVEGTKTFKTVFIVTDQIEEVRQFILTDLHRGGTCFSGVGLFQGAERRMIYVTLGRAELVKLKSNIRHIDPMAFINVIDSAEILGLGFKTLPKDEE